MKSKKTLIRKITSIALAAVCVISTGYAAETAYNGIASTVSAAQEPLQNKFGSITPRNANGDTVIKFSAIGGSGSYTYDVEIAPEDSTAFKKVNKTRITSSQYAFKINSDHEIYQVRTTVYDGKTSARSPAVKIRLTKSQSSTSESKPLTNTSALDLDKCGASSYKLRGKTYAYVNCSATGGSGKYNYKIEFKNSKVSGWEKVTTYTNKTAHTVRFKISDYTYDLKNGSKTELVKTNVKKGNDYLIRVTVTDVNSNAVGKSKVISCTTKA